MARHVDRLPGSFEDRCLAQATRKEVEAQSLPPGQFRDDALRDARQMRVAADLEKWLASPGLKSPT